MSSEIQSSVEQGVLTLTLNRPEKKNALTQAMYTELAKALETAEQDESLHAVVLQGTPGCFCAGNDLKDFLAITELNESSPPFRFLFALQQLSVPVIAAVDGVAIGIGTTILMHCDFVYVTDRSVFALPFIHLGLVPEAGSSLLLPLAAGQLRAAELLLLGEQFSAEEAARCQLVTEVVSEPGLMPTVVATLEKLRAKPAAGLRATKRLLRQPIEATRERMQKEAKVFAEALQSKGAKQAISEKLNAKK